jgi:flagellar hook protein FlgE
MALTSTLFTGLSGLDVNQTRMNVVGNNIANVNTVAYKASRALFKPQFYVTDAAGSPPSSDFGGTNPSQRGLGASLATIQKDFTQGAIESTGKPTDMAIDGQGFFVVQDQSNGQQFTRDGSFTLNANHQLVTSGGAFVQGYGVDPNGNVIPGQLQNITVPLGSATIAKATDNVQLVGNLAADGQVASGASIIDGQDIQLSPAAAAAAGTTVPTSGTLLTDLVSTSSGAGMFAPGQTFTLNAKRNGNDIPSQTFSVTPTSTVGDLQTFFNNALGIDTSVAGAGANIPAGTAPGSVKLEITGNSGSANALTVTTGGFADPSGNTPFTFTANPAGVPAGESTHTSMTVYDSLGVPVNIDMTTVLQSASNTGTTWKFYANSADNIDTANPGATQVGTGTLKFDSNGQLTSVTGGSLTIHRDNTGATPTLPIQLDFSGVSSLAQDAAHKGSDMEMASQDGIQLGTLASFSVGADGTITGAFDNGKTRSLGQLAIATFNNPQGLDDKGGNMFVAGADSGVPIITAPETLGSGGIRSGALEQSNVDLSSEFINLIVASTGFSASSRVISTSDQLLTELLNTQH